MFAFELLFYVSVLISTLSVVGSLTTVDTVLCILCVQVSHDGRPISEIYISLIPETEVRNENTVKCHGSEDIRVWSF